MGRQNYLVSTYSEIALQQYTLLRDSYEELRKLTYMCDEAIQLQRNALESYIITTTFAAMAIEAYFNDYAATNLGDSYYYDNYEGLRPVAKLHFVAKFLCNVEIKNDDKLCFLVKTLFQERNKLVHCKSKNLVGMTKEECDAYNTFIETDAGKQHLEDINRINHLETKELVEKAHQSLRTLKEVAAFMDIHDDSAHAMARLLCSEVYSDWSPEKFRLISEAQKALGIPIIHSIDETTLVSS